MKNTLLIRKITINRRTRDIRSIIDRLVRTTKRLIRQVQGHRTRINPEIIINPPTDRRSTITIILGNTRKIKPRRPIIHINIQIIRRRTLNRTITETNSINTIKTREHRDTKTSIISAIPTSKIRRIKSQVKETMPLTGIIEINQVIRTDIMLQRRIQIKTSILTSKISSIINIITKPILTIMIRESNIQILPSIRRESSVITIRDIDEIITFRTVL